MVYFTKYSVSQTIFSNTITLVFGRKGFLGLSDLGHAVHQQTFGLTTTFECVYRRFMFEFRPKPLMF